MIDPIARLSKRTDGNFKVPQPHAPLAFTGERMTTEIEGQIEYEHYHRYCLARDLCDGLDVLDVASGEGYGSALLAGVARSVIGVEIDPGSVAHSVASYAMPNLRFQQGDALALPIPNASVDVVVSFETLEHVADHARFVSEVRRVLRPGGLFLVSTPDRAVYSAPGMDPNPYHVLELNPPEFRALLSEHFAHSEMLWQRPVLGSVLAAEGKATWRSYERRGAERIEATSGLARAHYLIGIASDAPLPPIGSSVYLDRRRVHDVVQDALSVPTLREAATQAKHVAQQEVAQERATALEAVKANHDAALEAVKANHDAALEAVKANHDAALEAVKAKHDAAIEIVRTECDTARREIGETRQAADEAIAHAQAEAAAAAASRDIVLNSTMWRITAPLRRLGMRFPGMARNLRRLAKLLWWTLTLQLTTRVAQWRNRPAALAPAVEAPPPAPAPESVSVVDLRTAFQALCGGAAIHFPAVTAPEVSIIIPAYRGREDLLTCLRSLAVYRATEPSFEVILVDDCPAEPVLHAVPRSPGLIPIANEENLGFLLSCNRGAAAARGRVLVMLNSDTIVTSGWLRSLIEALDSSPRAGIAGSMLLNRDGTIQDAGWRIMWNGWGHPLGRGADARDGAYTHRRLVDCVTGACMAVRRTAWDELNGFDNAYAPAFYEEFDLAFRAKAKGFEVIYEPRSRVVHLGSASYGAERRDELSGLHHATFKARFETALRRQPHDTADEFAIRHAGHARPVILVADYGVPQPDRHAGDVTMTAYLHMLVGAGWRVVFGPRNGIAEGVAADGLEAMGIEMIRTPQTIEGWIEAHGRHLTKVWLSRPEIAASLIASVRAHSTAQIAYYTHDLHHLRLEREAAVRNDPMLAAAAGQLREQEVAVLQGVDRIMTPSAEEGTTIQRLAPGVPVTTLPPYHYDAQDVTQHAAAHFAPLSDIIFIGGFPHTPNVDAALFIAREVMPIVWQDRPDARLLLVGYAPPEEVRALATSRIIVTGQVPDLAPWLAQSRVMLAALRFGAGVKGKVVEALRAGVPVVATQVGAEGIGIAPGQEAILAKDAPGLAAGVLALLGDAERCAAMSAAGAELVRRRFSRAAARAALDEALHTPRCASCGSHRLVAPPLDGNHREAFVCLECYALGRAEALAQVILRRFARNGETSMPELMRRNPGLRVHELGFVGGIAEALRGFPNYSMSEFFPGVPLGEPGPDGVRCEDVTQLTFDDASFDIVLSQDVMEHVPDPVRGFAETARVLRPGGSHLFTLPQNRALPHSVTRARLGPDGVEHVLSPEYHGDPVRAEGALVFTDYGADLPDLMIQAGLVLIEHEQPVLGGREQEKLRIFEAMRPAILPLPDLSHDDALAMADLQDKCEAFEILISRCYAAELNEGDTAIDGGANFGTHTGPLSALVGPRGRVFAFEPLPHAVAAVRQMYGHLPQLTLHQKALGEQAGRATFHHVVSDAALSSLLKRDHSFDYPDLEVQEIDVETVTLDSMAAEPVRFIKLDLEGYDFLALRGARALLRQQRPIIAFEFGWTDAATPAGYGAEEFFSFFDELDYQVLDLFGRPFARASFDLPWHAREMPHYVMAVPRERADVAVRLRHNAWGVLMSAGRQPAAT